MNQSTDPICPVCTLVVRREIPLEEHLNTHPKDQVIRALINKVSGSNSSTSLPPSNPSPALPPPPPLTPAPTTFQYIQSPNNVVQYPYHSFIPIVYNPFGVSTTDQTSFLPQGLFNGANLAGTTPRSITATSGASTVSISGISINTGSVPISLASLPSSITSNNAASTTVPVPLSAPTASTVVPCLSSRVSSPAAPSTPRVSENSNVTINDVIHLEGQERSISDHEAILPNLDSRGMSNNESILPDLELDAEEEEEEEEDDAECQRQERMGAHEEPEPVEEQELQQLEEQTPQPHPRDVASQVNALICCLEQEPLRERRCSSAQSNVSLVVGAMAPSPPPSSPAKDEPTLEDEEPLEESNKSGSRFLLLGSPTAAESDSNHKKEPEQEEEDDGDITAFSEHLSLDQLSPKDTVSMRDIQTDETMPAQGELSEESLGADTASLWGPAAEDVFSELASHGHAPSSHLLSDWPPLLAGDMAEPTSSRDAAASSSSSSHSNGCVLVSDMFGLNVSEVKLEVKPEQWVKLESDGVKHETIQLGREPEKLLLGVLGEESLLVQQSDNRRQQQCQFCHETFSSIRDLKIHKAKQHRRTTYKCNICLLEFSDRSQYHAHNKSHPLECLQCGKTFGKRAGLTLHMKRHLGVKPYKCTVCDKGFITNQKLIEHSNGHTGKKPHTCKDCGKAFKRYSNLVQHKNWVHKRLRKAPVDMMCDFCNKIFHTKRSMMWHLETHLKTPRVCCFCPQRFIHNSSLTRHIRTMHDRKYVPQLLAKPPTTYVECPECFGIFCKTSLAAHLRTHSGDRPFSCNICFKAFATKWNLQQHRWTHEGPTNRPLRCTMCRKSYFRKEDLECHIRSHKNVRPYCCDFCGLKFARRYNCIRHMREHISDKQFCCNLCQKSFHRSYYLKEHMRVHTGIKPWTCHICGKGSTTKSNHNKHVKTHHARESVTPEH